MNKGKKRKKQKRPPQEPVEPAPRTVRQSKAPAIEPEKKGLIDLGTLLFMIIVLWAIPDLMGLELFYLLWYVGIMAVAAFLIVRWRKIKKQDVWITLGIVAICFYSNPLTAVAAAPSYLAACSVVRARGEQPPLLVRGPGLGTAASFAAAAGAGALMALITLWVSGVAMAPSFSLYGLLAAINLAVTDEVIFRFFLLGLCLHVTGNRPMSKGENILTYAVMSVPYVLTHLTLFAFNLLYFLVLLVVVALPLAYLMRKRGLAVALTAHLVAQIMQAVLVGA